jgi:hypothetical protein
MRSSLTIVPNPGGLFGCLQGSVYAWDAEPIVEGIPVSGSVVLSMKAKVNHEIISLNILSRSLSMSMSVAKWGNIP